MTPAPKAYALQMLANSQVNDDRTAIVAGTEAHRLAADLMGLQPYQREIIERLDAAGPDALVMTYPRDRGSAIATEARRAAWEQMRERMNSPVAVGLHRLEAFPQRPVFVESNPSLVTDMNFLFTTSDPEISTDFGNRRWAAFDMGEVLTESPPCEMFASPLDRSFLELSRYHVIPETGNRKERRRRAAKNRKGLPK